MKNQIFLVISTLIFSTNTFGQIPREELVKIKDSLQVEIIKSKKNKLITDAALKTELSLINDAIIKNDSLFPFQPYDSVTYSMYNIRNTPELMDWSDSNKLVFKKLNEYQIERLLILISNPLNFSLSGSCGKGIIESKIEFFRNGKSIAEIQLSNRHSQLYCYPDSRLIRFGCKRNGYDIYDKIIKAQ